VGCEGARANNVVSGNQTQLALFVSVLYDLDYI
jgi:hypothetical protein